MIKLVKADLVPDVCGEVCPLPLVKTRRALDKLERGRVLEVVGTNGRSRADIVMAVRELGMQLEEMATDKDGKWRIRQF